MKSGHDVTPADGHEVWTRTCREAQDVMHYQRGLAEGLREGVRIGIWIRFGRPLPEVEAGLRMVDDPEIIRAVLHAVQFAPDIYALSKPLSSLDLKS